MLSTLPVVRPALTRRLCIRAAMSSAPALSQAAERNKQPILEVLQRYLHHPEFVLEVASGTGQHVAHFGRQFTSCTWQPSDYTSDGFTSIACKCQGLANVREPLVLDTSATVWPMPMGLSAVVCINMIHISPWIATEGLFRGAGAHLAPGAYLFAYGPFLVNHEPTTQSNADFDVSLRERNKEWGLRDVSVVQACAEKNGLSLVENCEMPANNFTLVFQKPL